MQKKPKRIFISYRWSFAYNQAKLLQRAIEAHFENVVVFRDEEKGRPGASISRMIRSALDETDLVLALLHPNWQRQPPKSEGVFINKLFLKDDWVRMELDYAKNQQGLKVIPVLCDGATLPPRNEEDEKKGVLPECLHFLCDDILSANLDRSNESEEGFLRLLEKELSLVRKKSRPKPPPRNRLREEGLELPDVMPNKEEISEPFLGLPYFEEKHARLFFGRSDDICELWDLLERKPHPLLLLYGYSGVGKSSLLNAGLFPRAKQKGWEVTARRRDAGRTLDELLREMLDTVPPGGKTLLAIDQLEEALIEPSGEAEELPPFFAGLAAALAKRPGLKVLLGFRKEFLSEVQKQIKAAGLWHKMKDHFLEPLSNENLLEAVKLDDRLRSHYAFAFEASLPEKITAGIIEEGPQLHRGETSSKAPWLQLLLLNLWREARKEQGNFGELKLTAQAFAAVSEQSFPKLVDRQLAKLEAAPAPHGNFFREGLTLDLLHFLTTPNNTARVESDAELIGRYYAEEADLRAHLRRLENLQLVLRLVDRDKKLHTRLAHDALASVIRRRYEQSDKSVQRAHRIFEGKKMTGGVPHSRNPHSEKIQYSLIRDKEDIALLRQARPFMYRWSEAEQIAFDRGREAVERAEAELRDKTAFIFETLTADATALLAALEYPEALPKFKAALGSTVPTELKKERLRAGVEELVYFFAHTGRHYEEARQAAQLLLSFEPEENIRQLVEKGEREKWRRLEDFIPLLERMPQFGRSQFRARYLPTMIDIEGDTFEMGGRVSWEDPTPGQQSNPVHPVKLRSFRLARTPITFYQYALYCYATGRNVRANTPSWGRRGDHPAVYFTWYEAVEMANWLSAYLGKTPVYEIDKTRGADKKNQTDDTYKFLVTVLEGADGFRLPTEAEWEFAARGGVNRRSKMGKKGVWQKMTGAGQTPDFDYAGSNDLDAVGWYWKNSGDERLDGKWNFEKIQNNNGRTHPVAQLEPNELGLHDMSGNVYDWCADWFDWEFYEECRKKGAVENPFNDKGSEFGRVLRGGSWSGDDHSCRVVYRNYYLPSSRNNDVGWRAAQDLL